nr:type II secretion system F family protein [Candidatus Woesearchaeota archaeon]
MYRLFSYLYPKNVREKYSSLLRYTDIKTDPLKFLGFAILFGFGISLAFSFLISGLFKYPIWIILIISFLTTQASIYFFLSLKVDARAKAVEEILPDALQLMASNLKAGLTTEKALLLAARPEFGPFKDELNKVGKEITMGKDITEVLLGMTKRIKSEVLEKTIMLIVSGINSGGELADLLEHTAKNLRLKHIIDQKVRSGVLMYVIFIFIAICFGAPILFGLSSYLVDVLFTQFSQLALVEIPSTVSMPFSISGIAIKQDFIIKYSIVSLISTSILGSFVLGLISKGRENAGVKFIPLFIILTVSLFFLVRFFMKITLGGLFGA